jgi:hypothetical protein
VHQPIGQEHHHTMNSEPLLTAFTVYGCEEIINRSYAGERVLLQVGDRRSIVAARLFWTKLKGIIPDRMLVLHKPLICHNERCINVDHLYIGNHVENSQDRVLDGTSGLGVKRTGKPSWNKGVKQTEEEKLKMREIKRLGKYYKKWNESQD